MKRIVIILPLFFGGMAIAQKKAPAKKPATTAVAPTNLTDDQKASYYIGLNIAQNMKQQGFTPDVDLLARGMKEEFSGTKKLLPAEDMQNVMQKFSQKMNEKAQAEMKKIADENKKKSAAFLEKNKQNPAVKTTASGLQYEVVKEGDGKTKPSATDIVKVTYTGKLQDGTVFDSTDKNGGQPIEIPLNGVIKGWAEGIQLMSKGSKYKFYIPADLAYGDRGAGKDIKPGEAIIFDVELVDFKPQEAPKEVKPDETLKPIEVK